MNKATLGAIVAIIAVLGIGGAVLVSTKSDQNQNSESVDHSQMDHSKMNTNQDTNNQQTVQSTSVEIKDYAYSPAKIQVKKGTKVTWTNQDAVRHDVMPDQQSDDFKASELLSKGESYSFTFNKTGTYTYHCSPHPYMKAIVEVVD